MEEPRQNEHDKLIVSSAASLDQQLASRQLTEDSVGPSDGIGSRIGAARRNGSARESTSTVRMALNHPHPDSGGESGGDGEPNRAHSNGTADAKGGHLYCNDLEQLGPYFDWADWANWREIEKEGEKTYIVKSIVLLIL